MSLRVNWLSCSMFIDSQWDCFNLVDTCNIALIIFLKCDVTKFWILSPLSHNVTLLRSPSTPLTCDVIYGCPLSIQIKFYTVMAVAVLMYSSENRSLNRPDKRKIEVAGMRFLKPMAGYTLWDKISNTDIREHWAFLILTTN
jgi:hypothetical protein